MGEAFFLIKVLYTSMVKMVEAELKIEVSEDISAANITANIKPRKTEKKIKMEIGKTETYFP